MGQTGHIIICNGRIDLATAANPYQRIQAASHCATALVTYYGDRLTLVDTLPISDLQHEMMNLIDGRLRIRQPPKSADEMIDEMFAQLDHLEDKFG